MKRALLVAPLLLISGISLSETNLPQCQNDNFTGNGGKFFLTPPSGQTACQTTALTHFVYDMGNQGLIMDGYLLEVGVITSDRSNVNVANIYCGPDEYNRENYVMTIRPIKWPGFVYQIICTKKTAASN